jgi:uronate dehydrogenase
VPRIALASSLQVVSRPRLADEAILRVESVPSPRNHYAATKLFAEDMGLLYANKYGIEVLCPRIGWLPRKPEDARHIIRRNAQNVFLSHDDAGRFFNCFVEASAIAGPQPGYAIVFCSSRRTTENGPDLEPARRAIGYQPQDLFPAGLPFTF